MARVARFRSSFGFRRYNSDWQLRLRWLWITSGPLTIWLCIGGRRPASRMPVVRRLLWPVATPPEGE